MRCCGALHGAWTAAVTRPCFIVCPTARWWKALWILPSVKSFRPAPYGRWWTSKPIHGWKTNRNTPPSSTSIAQRSRGPQARLPAPYSYQSELSVRNPAGLEILSQDRIGAPIGQYLSAINNLFDSSKSTKHDFRGSVMPYVSRQQIAVQNAYARAA